jgi:hypothetical protein
MVLVIVNGDVRLNCIERLWNELYARQASLWVKVEHDKERSFAPIAGSILPGIWIPAMMAIKNRAGRNFRSLIGLVVLVPDLMVIG